MSDNDDTDVLAAEFVLGTLDHEERTQVEARVAADKAFADKVRGWERRLGALHVMVDAVEPPPELYERIRARIAQAPHPAPMRLPGGPSEAATAATGAEIIRLRRRLGRWRDFGSVTAALAAVLAVFVAVAEFRPDLLPEALRPRAAPVQTAELPPAPPTEPTPPAPPPAPTPSAPPAPSARYVAVLQKDASQPAFLVTVDLESKTLVIRRVSAEQEPGKSFELWLVSDKFSGPRSLGVVGSGDFTQRPIMADYDRETIDSATYAMSLEPEGGSPTGAPTGPVLYLGRLVEATPAPPASAKP